MTTTTTGNSQMMIKKAIAKLIIQKESTVPLGCRTRSLIWRSIELQPQSCIFMTRELQFWNYIPKYKTNNVHMQEKYVYIHARMRQYQNFSPAVTGKSWCAICHHLPFRHRGWHTFVSPRGKYSNMSLRHKSLSYRIHMQHRLRWPKIRKSESWFAKLMLHVFIQCCHAKYWFCDPLYTCMSAYIGCT